MELCTIHTYPPVMNRMNIYIIWVGDWMLVKSNANYKDLIVGADTRIPLSDGQMAASINFDNAATTPPFASVIQAIEDLSLIHISEPTRLLSISYAVFCLKKKKEHNNI